MKMKSVLIVFFYFICLTVFAQSKKTQIESLNAKVDSLTQLIDTERLRSITEKNALQNQIEKITFDFSVLVKKNDSLNYQLKHQISKISNLQIKNDSLVTELQKSLKSKSKHSLKNKEQIAKFIDDITTYCPIPKSNFFAITENQEKGVKSIIYDFSNLSLVDLINYNVETYEGLNLNLYLNTSNELIYGKATRSCCIADNQEVIFFFLGADFILFDHSAGQFGGTLTAYKNGKLINEATYEVSEESNEPVELFGEF